MFACSGGKNRASRYIQLKSDLVYREQPVRVLDTKERATRNSVVKTYKIQWDHHVREMQLGKQESIYKKLMKNFITNGS